MVGLCNRADLGVAQRAHHLDEDVFVGAQTADGVVHLPRVELGKWSHHRHDEVLEVSGQFALQVLNQILAVQGLELDFDLESLGVGTSGQHVDDRLFVSTESFHRFAKYFGVIARVERMGRYHRRRPLQFGNQYEGLIEYFDSLPWVLRVVRS
jgi:hypothetical protein